MGSATKVAECAALRILTQKLLRIGTEPSETRNNFDWSVLIVPRPREEGASRQPTGGYLPRGGG